ncbi:hypothetical protein OMP43_21770 [Sphingomonas sp. CBMAI 2297]|uniref:hypothetical protein n=1 Tax=Sphingomonas sp. CBMAI 2297 TaxID=2991720 RepID=UPI0024567C87|nr:hypothetical protein [Sphingomonas sp. CBMAI 2297]MDH4746659.1 hypothetical protein [Sphingomonas sp. CBMAI 2297]
MNAPHPLLDVAAQGAQFEALVILAKKRTVRAEEKRDAANREFSDAFAALDEAKARLAGWLAANPRPQLTLPGISPEGEDL